ncbi:neuronal acetylcholine receptor subunit alpha-5-like [Argiope bruennichi]|uniref:neuronal acetylcholine receptor subunit alpha-5-like n=1 Tax=Argiope bruennichi TaxID=94029 RepID=UPI0024943BD9|nr:neuronal acetylcholine receptor subunit alpha-5-like [Argiope bruennichi]
MAVLTFSLFLCLIIGNVVADEIVKNDSDLRKDLFANYDKLVRPVRKASDVIHVKFVLAPFRIIDVDVTEKTITMDAMYLMWWDDPHFIWNPADYDGLDELSLPPTEVWRPDVALFSATPGTSLLPEVFSNVNIFHNGTVLWAPPFTFKARCPSVEGQVNFNTFRCVLEMGSWTYDANRMIITESEQDVLNGVGNETFEDSNENWKIIAMTASSEQKLHSCCPVSYSQLKFDILLHKKPQRDPYILSSPWV